MGHGLIAKSEKELKVGWGRPRGGGQKVTPPKHVNVTVKTLTDGPDTPSMPQYPVGFKDGWSLVARGGGRVEPSMTGVLGPRGVDGGLLAGPGVHQRQHLPEDRPRLCRLLGRTGRTGAGRGECFGVTGFPGRKTILTPPRNNGSEFCKRQVSNKYLRSHSVTRAPAGRKERACRLC